VLLTCHLLFYYNCCIIILQTDKTTLSSTDLLNVANDNQPENLSPNFANRSGNSWNSNCGNRCLNCLLLYCLDPLQVAFGFFRLFAKFIGLYPIRDNDSICGKYSCFCKPLNQFLIIVTAFVFFLVNLSNVGLNVYSAVDQTPKCAHSLGSSNNNFSDIIQLSPPLDNGKYGDFQKFVFLSTEISAFLSYVFMFYSLNKCVKRNGSSRIAPFSNDNYSKLGRFMGLFFSNFLFIVISTTILSVKFRFQYQHTEHCPHYYLDLFGMLTHTLAWTSTFLSCFIFSKVAYDVAHECRKMLPKVIDNAHKTLDDLIDIDQEYIEVMKSSIVPFSSWFAVHWLTYCLTTFLSISFVIQNIQHDLYVKDSSCYKEGRVICWLALTYHTAYAFGHGILFIYPCLRAAALSTERTKLICSIAKEKKIPEKTRQAFVQYLQIQDCSFKVNFFCTKVTFGGNLTYFSIFAGIMTVALRIAL